MSTGDHITDRSDKAKVKNTIPSSLGGLAPNPTDDGGWSNITGDGTGGWGERASHAYVVVIGVCPL